MLTIRLVRMGKTNRPHFRIVVQEAREKLNGAYKESLGHYDPIKPGSTVVKADRVKVWIARGAKPSAAVRTIIKNAAKAAAS